MPNHITNILTVSGSPEEVERFRIAVSIENPVVKKIYLDKLLMKKEKFEKHLSGEERTYYKDSYVEENLKKLNEQIESQEFEDPILDFNGTVPMPEELIGTVSGSEDAKPEWQKQRSAELIKKYGADNWYNWCATNWSTKWGAYDIADPVRNDDGSITYRFDTAWSPPVTWLEKTSELFPSLTFEDAWHDEGGGAGTITICVDEGLDMEQGMSDLEWYLEADPWFKEEMEFIQSGNYEEVINKYSKAGEAENNYHNEELLKRIKDEDLPLFMNYEWWGDDKDNYRERMAKIGHEIES